MELVFVWIQKFRNIENLSLSFSNEFDFSYNLQRGKIEKSKKSDIQVKDFYGESITNLTAIVGQNGVGKSTIFYFIRLLINDLKFEFLDEQEKKRLKSNVSNVSYVALFKINNQYFHFKNKINSTIKDFSELSYRHINHIKNFNCFYYANFFDYSANERLNRIYDLSTSAVLNDIYSDIREKTFENEDHIYDTDFLEEYKVNEIFSQIQFVANFDNHVPFELPNRLSIRLILDNKYIEDFETDEEDINADEESIKYSNAVKLVEALVLKFQIELQQENTETVLFNYVKAKIQSAIITFLLKDNVFHPTNVAAHYELNFDITAHYSLRKIANIRNLDKLFVDLIDLFSIGNENYDGESILRWITKLVGTIDVKKYYDFNNDVITFDFNENKKEEFLILIKKLSEFRIPILFFNFYWEGISSGENALITIFSRFYKFKNNFNSSNSSIILIFDECEINFHPAWQRKLIFYLTTIFPEIFNNSKLQFFISSHSPLILSDIPKSNIIFLQKGNDNKVLVSHLSDKKQTFAANIHTLLADAFFMDEGTIGEVAKMKINWIIESIDNKYIDFEKKQQLIQQIVEIIGEPIIKSKLISMINEKHSLSFYNINQRLKTLEKRF